MPSYFVVQPNGLLARFSTVVDDFTAMNMSESEATEDVINEYTERAKRDAEKAITRAKNNKQNGSWEDCLGTIRRIHGDAAVAERLKWLELDPEPVPANLPSSGVGDAPGWTPGRWVYTPIPGYQYVIEMQDPDRELPALKLVAHGVPPDREAEVKANLTLAAAAPDLYTALQELLKSGAHEGPCDNCDLETGEYLDDAGPCEAHLRAAEARKDIARAALAKARGEKP